MDFSHNESQRELAALSRTILADRATPERLPEVEARGDRFAPGLWADLMLVPAATAQGITVFLVAPADHGVALQPQQMTDGDAAGYLELADVELPDDRVLGSPAAGTKITEWLVSRGTVGLCAQQLGVVERALELTSAHAKSRMQFGRPIGSFQAVAQRLADAYIDVEAVPLTPWH